MSVHVAAAGTVHLDLMCSDTYVVGEPILVPVVLTNESGQLKRIRDLLLWLLNSSIMHRVLVASLHEETRCKEAGLGGAVRVASPGGNTEEERALA